MQVNNRAVLRALALGLLAGTIVSPSFAQESVARNELKELIQMAVERDPALLKLDLESQALEQKAVADGQLMDPRIKLGVTAIPLDHFELDREPMTQQQIGIQQAFPRGDSLNIKRQRGQSTSREKKRLSQWQSMKIRRDVRLAYLAVVYQRMAFNIIQENKALFKQLVDISKFRYAAGKEKQQRVLETELTLSRLDDRLLKVRTQEEMARAKLSIWLPRERAFGNFQSGFPILPPLPDRKKMLRSLASHPAVLAVDAVIESRGLDLRLAQEQYKPGWMLDATYGRREGKNPNGSARTDFLSAMVSFDLPIFTENRQDRVQEAQRLKTQAAEFQRDDRLRLLRAKLETDLAKHARLGERLKVFSARLIPDSKSHRNTTLTGYQSQVTDLTDVIRSYLLELKTKLGGLEVHFKRLATHARLLYLVGENK